MKPRQPPRFDARCLPCLTVGQRAEAKKAFKVWCNRHGAESPLTLPEFRARLEEVEQRIDRNPLGNTARLQAAALRVMIEILEWQKHEKEMRAEQ